MTITMYDSVDPNSIPASAGCVAGYVDGKYAWTSWSRFPNAIKVRIAVFATTNDGDVLDCEPGNCTPAQAVDWVLMRRKAGKDPIVYCNQLDTTVGLPAVRLAFQQRGVPDPHYWVANYDGVATIPAGTIGKQYTDNPPNNPYDTSVMDDSLPAILSGSGSGTNSSPDNGDDMYQRVVYDAVNKQQHFVLIAGATLYHRVYDENTGHMSSPSALPGGAINPSAGVDAAIMSSGTQLHVFSEYANTSGGTGAHYWLSLPVDSTKAESWGVGTI